MYSYTNILRLAPLEAPSQPSRKLVAGATKALPTGQV